MSDIVTLHLPLTADTRNLLGARRLALLRDSAYLINTARGGIVDEVSLARRLRDGRPRGAGIDRFAVEPPVGNPYSIYLSRRQARIPALIRGKRLPGWERLPRRMSSVSCRVRSRFFPFAPTEERSLV